MNFKKIALALTFSTSFGLMVACNDDSSSSTAAPSSDDTPVSSSSVTEGSSDAKGNAAGDVKSSSSESNGNENAQSSDSDDWLDDYDCSNEEEGKKLAQTINGYYAEYVCKNGNWTEYQHLEQVLCFEEGSTKTERFDGSEITFVCKDYEWTLNLGKCSKDGDTKEFSVKEMKELYPDFAAYYGPFVKDTESVTLICIEGDWTIEAETCTEGESSELEYEGYVMEMRCVDGEWTTLFSDDEE